MSITGRTRIVGLVGDPIVHARSPALFNRLFQDAQYDGVCLAFEVKATDFATFFAGIRTTRNVDALFVTTPHKASLLAMLDELSRTARTCGSVNVARRQSDGKWRGVMFDGLGCVLGLRAKGIDIAGSRVLLFGCGAAGRAIGLAVAMAGARQITLVDKVASMSEQLALLIRANHPACSVSIGEANARDHDIFINASTLGMQSGDASPFPDFWLSPEAVIVDLVAEPDASRLGKIAQKAGCRIFGGQLVHRGQAILAARFIRLEYWPSNWPPVAFDDLIDN